MESITLRVELPIQADELFRAWLDSKAHSLFTGALAEIDPTVGGSFTAWDGYISGKSIEIEPPRRILQRWRTTEFNQGDPDSKLELLFEPNRSGTCLTLVHTDIPDGQSGMYREGWEEYYFAPMQEYYCKENDQEMRSL